MIPRLYLDEDMIPDLARLMRKDRYDVVSAHDIGALQINDDEQLAIATSQQRAIVSSNHHDFRRIAMVCAATGIEHWGIILVYRQFKRDDLGSAVRALSRFIDNVDAEALRNATYVLDERTMNAD